jgi:hypothetical protein
MNTGQLNGSRRKLKVTMIALAAVTASALMPVSSQASGSTYYYQPGDPMYFGGPGALPGCTGGYVIRGASGTFLLTDGHCTGLSSTGQQVYGTVRAFGSVSYTKYPNNDTLLISEVRTDDAYQTVQDPLTRKLPGGSGKVVGYLSDADLVNGLLVGKMGERTGWTEGPIFQQGTYDGMNLYCSRAQVNHGDSGGPVWRAAEGGGVYAVGITVTKTVRDDNPSDGCFVSIADLLKLWGGYLPVWTSNQGGGNSGGEVSRGDGSTMHAAQQTQAHPTGPPPPRVSSAGWAPAVAR